MTGPAPPIKPLSGAPPREGSYFPSIPTSPGGQETACCPVALWPCGFRRGDGGRGGCGMGLRGKARQEKKRSGLPLSRALALAQERN